MAGEWKRVGSRWVSPTGASISNDAHLILIGHNPRFYGKRGRARAAKLGITPNVNYRPSTAAPEPIEPEPIRATTDPFTYMTNKAGMRMAVADQRITLERLRLTLEKMPGRFYTVAVEGRHPTSGNDSGKRLKPGESPKPGQKARPQRLTKRRFFSRRLTRSLALENGQEGEREHGDVRSLILGWLVVDPGEIQIVAHE